MMKKRYLMVAALLAFSAVVNAGFSDDFTDGNRDGWWKTNDSANYSLTVADDSGGIGSGNALFLTTDSNTRRVLAGFNPAVLLDVDDFITLGFDIRLNGVTDTSNALRFGLYSDMGTPMDADYIDVTASPAADDQGYYIRMGTGTGTTVQVYKDTDEYILGGSDASSSYQQYSGSYAGINDTDKHHFAFTITRTSDGMAFRLDIDGATVVDGSKTTAYPLTEYNQIGFASYSGGLDFVLDNVTINSLDDLLAAHDPIPADDAIGVSTASMLSWHTGMDPNYLPNVNPAITKHYVYFKESDPNFIGASPVSTVDVAYAGEPTASYTPSLDVDKIYYWRVDESVNDSSPSDPNTIKGPVWMFGTQSQALVVTQPGNMIAAPMGTAETMIEVSSMSTPHYVWYKSGDAANDTPGDDTAVGGDSDTLSLSDVSVADEGYYFCVVSNASPLQVYSDVVMLGIKRPVAHWTLDELVAGQYEDGSGEGHNADPNGTPVFVSGAVSNGVQIDGSGVADAGTWNPSQYTNQFTLSLWTKWAGQTIPATYQGLLGKRNGWAADQMMWQLEVSQASNTLGFKTAPSTTVFSKSLAVDEWELVTVTFDGNHATIYHNGVAVGEGGFAAGTKTDANFVIGASELSDEGLYGQFFNGAIDDIRIYNYAMSDTEVADLYHAVTGQSVCILNYASAYDYNNDCIVNLADIATIASVWLDCGLYPACQ